MIENQNLFELRSTLQERLDKDQSLFLIDLLENCKNELELKLFYQMKFQLEFIQFDGDSKQDYDKRLIRNICKIFSLQQSASQKDSVFLKNCDTIRTEEDTKNELINTQKYFYQSK